LKRNDGCCGAGTSGKARTAKSTIPSIRNLIVLSRSVAIRRSNGRRSSDRLKVPFPQRARQPVITSVCEAVFRRLHPILPPLSSARRIKHFMPDAERPHKTKCS
jgi:hypothetical protein